MKTHGLFQTFFWLLTSFCAAYRLEARPPLVLVLVFDQFRADYLSRFHHKFLPPNSHKGFRFLMEKGAYFPVAEYDVLQSMTGPGHATILTGSYPYTAGIPINDWFNVETGEGVYCVEDAEFKNVGGVDVQHEGRSPRKLFATTVGDEIKNVDYPSKVVSVSLKDRAAILLGGHRADLALWFQSQSGDWSTSTYYLKDGKLPTWISNLTEEAHKKLCNTLSDCGFEMTVTAALAAQKAYRLGQENRTDLLAISFSTIDMAGHRLGLNDPEMERLTLAADKQVDRLLTQIEHVIPGGLKNVVIAMTGDHGAPSRVDYLKSHGIEAGFVDTAKQLQEVDRILSSEFGHLSSGTWLHESDFNYFFNRKALESKKVSLEKAIFILKKFLEKDPAFAYVFSSDDVRLRRLPPQMFERQILKTYFPSRSGDVVAIPRPFFMSSGVNVTHMTGYSYDRSVPLILYGQGVQAGVHPEHIEVISLAPTLSYLTETIPPALSEGRILVEALRK